MKRSHSRVQRYLRSTIPAMVGIAILWIAAGCGELGTNIVAPTQHDGSLASNLYLQNDGESIPIDSATITFTESGEYQTLSFADLDGNSYWLTGRYDAAGRLRELRTYYNGQLLGTDEPAWSGETITSNLNSSSDGRTWVVADDSFQPVAAGDGGIIIEGGDLEPLSSDCDLDTGDGALIIRGTSIFLDGRLLVANGRVFMSGSDLGGGELAILAGGTCWDELHDYAWEGVALVASVAAVGAASSVSGGLATIASVGNLAYRTRQWYKSLRALADCHAAGEEDEHGGVQPE
jgi:hypothetical protein